MAQSMVRPVTAPVRIAPVKPIRRLKGYPPTPISTPERQLAYRFLLIGHQRLLRTYVNNISHLVYSARNRDYKQCKIAIELGADVNHYEALPFRPYTRTHRL